MIVGVIIAVTGSIGSGKSIVARELASLMDAEHCDTDLICREMMEKGQEGRRQVVALWGRRFLNDDDSIDRTKLREAIFNDSSIRQGLEEILHPLVREYLHGLIQSCRQTGKPLVIEIPLLFETGWQDEFDVTVNVSAQNHQCIDRVMKRDMVTREQAVKALEAQMDMEEKNRRSHYVIDNSGSMEKTLFQVAALKSDLQRKQDHEKQGVIPGKTLDS